MDLELSGLVALVLAAIGICASAPKARLTAAAQVVAPVSCLDTAQQEAIDHFSQAGRGMIALLPELDRYERPAGCR
jgi:hypothetical protein